MSVPKKSNSTAATGSVAGPAETMAASLRPAAGNVPGRRVIDTSLLGSARDVHRRDEPPDATSTGPSGLRRGGRALPPLPHRDPAGPRATPRDGPGGRGGLPHVPPPTPREVPARARQARPARV